MEPILVIDDEANIRRSLALFLAEKGYEVHTQATAAAGLAEMLRVHPRVVILDVRLPDANGLDLLEPIKEALPECRVIVITAYHDMETTIRAMRAGAFDYLHKPLDVDELEQCVERAAHVPELVRARKVAEPILDTQDSPYNQLVGSSRSMRQIFKTIGLLTASQATVLIEGETGTGKEVIARVIHERSDLADQPFITVDCTTLVDDLMESELFGHEKGAFTGASTTKRGRLEVAGRGTIFFDELGELSPRLQAKLLRFLERREFMRVGGAETLRSEARIIGATNRSLDEMSVKGGFRSDLLYRFKVARIQVPPLRERLEDLDELVPFFLQRINRELGMHVLHVEKGAMALLRAHTWPGNVRELLNVLTKAVIDSKGPVLLTEAAKSAITLTSTRGPDPAAVLTLAEAESRHIAGVLESTGYNVSAAARLLGVSRPTLRSRMARHGLKRPG